MVRQILRGISLLAESTRPDRVRTLLGSLPATHSTEAGLSTTLLGLGPKSLTAQLSAALLPSSQSASSTAQGMSCSLLLQQHRSMACSAGLGRAPPKVINIEYDPEDLEAFIQVADAIEEAFPTVVVNGNEDGDGRPGSFEVLTEDGINLYSRFAMHVLPAPQDVLQRIASRAKLGVADEENRPFCG